MKLPIVCPECMKDDIGSVRPIAAVEFRDDGRYEVACPKGHQVVVLLQQQKLIRTLEDKSINGVQFECEGVLDGVELRVTTVPQLTQAGRRRIEGTQR